MLKQAFVNGEPISKEAVQFELDRLIKFYASHGMPEDTLRQNLPKLVERAQEQAIGAKLLLDRAAQLEIPVPDAAIDAQVAKVVEQIGGHDNFVKALAQQKLSEADFRKELAKGCRVDALVAQATAHVPDPSEHDITEYYTAHADEFVQSEQVLAQHILVTPKDKNDPASKAASLDEIKAVRARIVGGADFAAEAKVHSACPSGKEGGSLGWFGRGMMVPEFDKAAFALKKGEVSDVIETQFGYHIIYKTDEKTGGRRDFIEVHDQIRDLLRHEARGRAMDAFVAELREKAQIEYKEPPADHHCHDDHCGCGK